jgi:16S rRNA (guanine966-N2)-methyltransferase
VTRIVGGIHGGRRLTTLPGTNTRPTSDRVREALFSTLDNQVELDGCRFADLYAGSGAVGLEAGSRGASLVRLVESDARAVRTVQANIAALGLGEICAVLNVRLPAGLARLPRPGYDVVFADPPYAADEREITALLTGLVQHDLLRPEAVVVVERSVRSPEPAGVEGITPERGRRYGESMLWYFRAAQAC